ncbi:hypothetical protein FDP41_005542 [Naegleria fowleri]|uniref:Uncharacterized protein n=1 Tax=Naegleria fowleri TaxID=5763 RepID=A0A6A5BN20_NAEFO|nr:uncharacterized protein FDP41_006064 [Naegleria fowleri]XP_044560261.1 uncharacterized protein FDP41_005542 [Naegleria fowleri]KAF0974897.1 hypothetical protein FDP41_006064 [Naegleria fowleri]KAF0975548.1 hypothetical protein FDP41_005542 [Naegleria fowleri]CAG4712968.1 unnamed protein product [Naegleria fowleri]
MLKTTTTDNKLNDVLDRLLVGTSVILMGGFVCLLVSLISSSEPVLSIFIQSLMSSLMTHLKYYVAINIPYLIFEILSNLCISGWFKKTEKFFLHLNPLILYSFVISFICSIGVIPMRMLLKF